MSSQDRYAHALAEIRRRLHDPRGSKAAVMIGAGFSRNAKHRVDRACTLPTWQKLTERLVEQLYLDPGERERVLRNSGSTSAATRFAQEYETAFGRSSLIAFLREQIPDDNFEPGSVHGELLELPWSDVFTTNYDRLLEVAARSLWQRYYQIVSTTAELPLVGRPRIVKLHGTLPNLQHLVITEEDYRTYPRNCAPLVAAVQASLTENVLCLIGFSGEDPNFLAWSGWLRDEMRTSTPSTYFFTETELKPFQQQLLQQRSITPIPLDALTGVRPFDFEQAYLWLFRELAKQPEPPSAIWNTGRRYLTTGDEAHVKEPNPDEAELLDAAMVWRQRRLDFKGWHVLNLQAQEYLWWRTAHWINRSLDEKLKPLSAAAQMVVLRELAWRSAVSMQPLQDDFVFKLIEPAMEQFGKWRADCSELEVELVGVKSRHRLPLTELDEAFGFLLLERLRHAREIADDDRFTALSAALKSRRDSANALDPNALAFATYQEALRLMGRLKHDECRALLEEWDGEAADPVWAVRRAALCMECGLLSLGNELAYQTLAKIRSVPPASRHDVRQLSAEGLLLNLLLSINQARFFRDLGEKPSAPKPKSNGNEAKPPEEKPRILKRLDDLGRYGCDPNPSWDSIKAVLEKHVHGPETLRTAEGFDGGSVERRFVFGSGSEVGSVYRAIRFIEEAAVPLSIPPNLVIGRQGFKHALRTLSLFAPSEAAGLFLRAQDKEVAEKVLTRECLLKLSDSQIDSLWTGCRDAIEVAVQHLSRSRTETDVSFWNNHFEIAITTLSRLVVRQREPEVRRLVETLSSLDLKVLRWPVLSPVWNCLARALKCLAIGGTAELLPILLKIPLPGSAGFHSHPATSSGWADPIEVASSGFRFFRWLPPVSLDQAGVEHLFGRIAVAQGTERNQSCLRAAWLAEAQLLSVEHQRLLVKSLFAQTDPHGFPDNTQVRDCFILCLPPNEDFDELAAFRAKYLEQGRDDNMWWELAHTRSPFYPKHYWSGRNLAWQGEDIEHLLDRAKDWLSSRNPSKVEPSPFGDHEDDAGVFVTWLAALENLVLLNEDASAEQLENADRLIQQAERQGWVAAQAAPARVLAGAFAERDAIQAIERALGDRNRTNVGQACSAALRWSVIYGEKLRSLPPALLELFATAVCQRRHPQLDALIHALTNILCELPQSDGRALVDRLSFGLLALLEESVYIQSSERRTFSVGESISVRKACARLAWVAAQRGLQNESTIRWNTEISKDLFADVSWSVRVPGSGWVFS